MTIDEFTEWMAQLDKYAKVLRDYGRLLTAIEDIKAEIEELNTYYHAPDALDKVLDIINKHINGEESKNDRI